MKELQTYSDKFLKRDLLPFAMSFGPGNSEQTISEQTIIDDLNHSVQGKPFSKPVWGSILIGEIVYNLRSALDYIVYELACLDSHQIIHGTQFPIEDRKEVFAKRIGAVDDPRKHVVYLRGLNKRHIEMIQQLQPCYGCYWTKTLASISNPDKHRHLTILKTPFDVRRAGEAELGFAYDPMHVNFKITRYIAFEDGLPVITTLQELKAQVSKTIEVFNPEFPVWNIIRSLHPKTPDLSS